jgi:undecaprenyl-diphosphatase
MSLAAESARIPTTRWEIDRRKALLAGLLCWVAAGLTAYLVLTERSGWLDTAGLVFWRASPEFVPRGPPPLLEMVRDLTALGGVLLRNLLAVGAAVALVFLRMRREAVLLVLTVATGWLVNSGIKEAIGRVRPDIVPHLTEAGGASFPSGHSFNSAVVFLAIALAFATLSSRQAVRLSVIGAAVALSLAVAWSRVWLGVHFPTDVIAGWLGGTGWALLASALLRRPAAIAERAIAETASESAQ